MENNLINREPVEQPVTPVPALADQVKSDEQVVIYDECGDTLWDRVLAQHDNLFTLKNEVLG